MMALIAAMAFSTFAADNTIYIDQAGDNATVTINQDGAGNRVKGIVLSNPGQTNDPAKIHGDGLQVNISQIGAGNVLSMGVVSDTASGSSPTSINYSVTGGSNIGYINLNNAGVSGANSSTNLSITQTGGNNTTNVDVLGTGNGITAIQSGGYATFSTVVNADGTVQNITTSGGSANSVTTNLSGNTGNVSVSLLGGSNTVQATQSGGGAAGHSLIVDVNGSGNSVNTMQTGSIDTTINVKSVGSNNQFTLSTKN